MGCGSCGAKASLASKGGMDPSKVVHVHIAPNGQTSTYRTPYQAQAAAINQGGTWETREVKD